MTLAVVGPAAAVEDRPLPRERDKPITYIIDADGRVVYRIIGQTTEPLIGGYLDKLLA